MMLVSLPMLFLLCRALLLVHSQLSNILVLAEEMILKPLKVQASLMVLGRNQPSKETQNKFHMQIQILLATAEGFILHS